MVDFDFYKIAEPILRTNWYEQKKIFNLRKKSNVFITSLYSPMWLFKERFPNAGRCALFHYWSAYGDRRVKHSLHWERGSANRINAVGSEKSKVFGEKW